MRLVSFTVKQYRSLTKSSKIPISDMTILVGANNQGKSNILQALVTALRVMTEAPSLPTRRAYRYDVTRTGYRWERDYPIELQQDNPSGRSQFTLEFEMSHAERIAFRSAVGSALNTNLRLTLKLGRHRDAHFEVTIQGPAKAALSKKRSAIADFVKNHLEFAYVPSLRTSEISVDIVESMLARALRSIESKSEYQNLLSRLVDLQRPVFDEVAANLRDTLDDFIPEVKSVEVKSDRPLARTAIRRSVRLLIDDGTKTDLDRKGDGIKSLAAIALMRQSSQDQSQQKSLILAIEEPESHLHPDSIHRLRDVLAEIATGHQLVITTHSPLLVDTVAVKTNIIVTASRARPAKALREVRDELGVRLADNLMSAYLVLLVEGESDRRILTTWLSGGSQAIRAALNNNTLVVEMVHGANLATQASFYKNSLCNVHAFADDDVAGRQAVDHAIREGTLDQTEYHLSTCPGMRTAEIEDLIDLRSYRTALEQTYGVTLDVAHFRNRQHKWSDRIRQVFATQGKSWSDCVEKAVKTLVADRVAELGLPSLHTDRRSSIGALAKALRLRLQSR
jgi:putative ATP-dependent endonuclease of OLD family